MSLKTTTTELHVEAKPNNGVIGHLWIENVLRMVGAIKISPDKDDPELDEAYRKLSSKEGTLEDWSEFCLGRHEQEEKKRREEVAKTEAPEIFDFLYRNLSEETFAELVRCFHSTSDV